MSKNIGICYSRRFEGENPLKTITGEKFPVYQKLFELFKNQAWNGYLVRKQSYLGEGEFDGGYEFKDGKFQKTSDKIKIDLVYDRTGGVAFPPEGGSLKVVNIRAFKLLCWDKWLAYKKVGKYMPATFWVGDRENLKEVLPKIKTKIVVLKPVDGLKGIGIFIGPASAAKDFDFAGRKYIAQEFVDTSGGINQITKGFHDLRVAIVNGKPVWCHVRTPKEGSLKANVAEGGTLTEIDYEKVPDSIKKIVDTIAKNFYTKYDNPAYSIDFGMKKNKPFIFEINDQIGFPTWEMKNRETFLRELVRRFKK